jgi:hypothetical protein
MKRLTYLWLFAALSLSVPLTAGHGQALATGVSIDLVQDYYTNSRGHRVHRPVRTERPPSGASAQCRDGTYSFSESRRGTCSHHGGVARWL